MARRGENIRKRADGRWEARIVMGRGNSGKTKYKSLYGKTYREVKEKRNALAKEKNAIAGKPCVEKRVFGELLDDWLEYRKADIKESTFAKYVFDVERHIRPDLGQTLICEMTTGQIDVFTRQKLTTGRLRKEGGLSPKTVSSLLSIIQQALGFGRERGYGLPDQVVIHNPRQALPMIQILDEAEREKLEKYIARSPDSRICIGILLSLYGGLRIGEVCALRWEDIQFEAKLLFIRRTMTRIQDISAQVGAKTKIVIGAPKTGKSYRRIPLPDFMWHYLRELREDPRCYFLTGGTAYMEPRSYYNHYKKIMDALGLAQYNYHALRHTFATRCVEQGFDAKSLSEILGHADVGTTLRRYVHPSMDAKRQLMQRLQTIL